MLLLAHIIIKVYMLLTSKPQRIPKGKSGETGSKGYTRRRKAKKRKHNTIVEAIFLVMVK
jgi:hypothetical protein